MNTCNICFYGAVRTLDKTSDSIKKYVINPLSKQYTVKIFATVWEDDDESPYSNFENVKIKKINRPKRFSKIKNEARENYFKEYGIEKDYLGSLYYALYSLKNVTNMVSKKINSGDITIFLRPDSKFYSEIPLEKI
jgi:capsid portal protein